MENSDVKQGQPVSPVVRTFKLLRYLAEGGSSANLSDVGRRLDINRVTVMRLLATLEHEGIIEALPQGGHRLGLGFLTLASTALGEHDMLSAARRVLARVTQQTELSSYLSVLDGGQVLYLLAQTPQTPLVSNIRVGSRVAAHLTTPGRVMLAYRSADEIRALLGDEPLPSATEQSVSSYAQLAERLAADRARGCAWSFSGFESSIDSCAAPVFDTAGQAIAALSVAGPTDRVRGNDAFQASIEQAVRQGAADLSKLVGYAPSLLQSAARAG